MMRSLYSAVSGLRNHQTGMDVIGNNISNVNTTGYKASRVIFQTIFSQTVSSATAATTDDDGNSVTGGTNAKQIGLGMTIGAVNTVISEGSTQSTDSELDFSISGEGYFVVTNANGTYYTRNGALQLDGDGNLVTITGGDFVMGVANTDTTDGEQDGIPDEFTTDELSVITMPADDDEYTYSDFAIDTNGYVTCTRTDIDTEEATTYYIGRIVLATFMNASALENEGSSLYSESANSGTVEYNYANDDCGALQSGSLEMSNVDLATELTNMIVMQRGFQANSRVITTSDTMLEELVNLKR